VILTGDAWEGEKLMAASPILVTGAAGFIGFHVARRLAANERDVLGIDNLNAYYDPTLKQARLAELSGFKNFRFEKLDLTDRDGMAALFDAYRFTHVVHLAAQAGVRHSLTAPHDYVDANITGFLNVLEGCRAVQTRHLLYASSSSVYGANTGLPFSVSQNVDHPLSLYGASKKANELMAHAYAHLFGLAMTGLRFFTVYGPWGRPDMAMWLFAAAILKGEPLKLFNHGDMKRDFTYVDDVVTAVVRLIDHIPQRNPAWSGDHPDPATSPAPWCVYNIGNHTAVELMEVVRLIEAALGRSARFELLPMQPGDVHETRADVTALQDAIGFAPDTPVAEGIKRFIAWFRDYHGV
jgi:UDP-glucuronate 4-epimerase